MRIYFENIKIDKLTFGILSFMIGIYYSIGPTMWIDSLFHVAYAETFFSSENYNNWYKNNMIYVFHEGFGFTILWKVSQILGLKYTWLIFAGIQNFFFLISLMYLHSSLEVYFKTRLKFYTLFFIYTSTLILFFNNAYMTESIPISLIIISFSIYLRFLNCKKSINNMFVWKTIFLLTVISFLISQFRMHWAFFSSFIILILLFQKKKIKLNFLIFYTISSLLIINFNPFVHFLKIDKYRLQIFGLNKVRMLTASIMNDTSEGFNKKLSLQIEKFLSENKIPYTGSKTEFTSVLSDHWFLAEYTKKLIEEGKSIFEVDDVFKEIYKKIYLQDEEIKALEKKYILKYFFWNSGLTYMFQRSDHIDKIQFRSYYKYLSVPDGPQGRYGLSQGWFKNKNIPNINNNQNKIFDSTRGVFEKSELLKITHKVFNIFFFTKKLNYEILASISLILIFLLLKINFFISTIFISTILINNLVTSNAFLSDARMMVLNYIIYLITLSFYLALIQSKLKKY
jgi:hypothetical protein